MRDAPDRSMSGPGELPGRTGSESILVTGATGYIGGRLVKALLARGNHLRCLARRPDVLAERFGNTVELCRGDLLAPETLPEALSGIHTAYYLVHSLGAGDDFERLDQLAASNFAEAAKDAGVQRIIYLGGLCDESAPNLSPHLRSRCEVGAILRRSGAVVLEFRASIIIGSGSLSFELIRALVQRLPVMVTPKWVSVQAQPIAVGDVLAYLVEALEYGGDESCIFEIGGTETMSYGDLMLTYARMRGLRRWMIPVPVLTPHLSSLWLGLVTPVYARIGRQLIDGMTAPSVVHGDDAHDVFDIEPLSVELAIEQALRNEDEKYVFTRWTDALADTGTSRDWGGISFGNRIVDSRDVYVEVSPEKAFDPIRRIGGTTGWYFGNWLWGLRGMLDRALGGVGMGRGRRDAETLRLGDVIDCWRVVKYEPPSELTLQAEMKLPGRAWLQFEVVPEGRGARIRQTAVYDPVGWLGLLYWYVLYPVHHLIFTGMLRNIGKAAASRNG